MEESLLGEGRARDSHRCLWGEWGSAGCCAQLLTRDPSNPAGSGVGSRGVSRRDPQGEGQPAPNISFLDADRLQCTETIQDFPRLVRASPQDPGIRAGALSSRSTPCLCWWRLGALFPTPELPGANMGA